MSTSETVPNKIISSPQTINLISKVAVGAAAAAGAIVGAALPAGAGLGTTSVSGGVQVPAGSGHWECFHAVASEDGYAYLPAYSGYSWLTDYSTQAGACGGPALNRAAGKLQGQTWKILSNGVMCSGTSSGIQDNADNTSGVVSTAQNVGNCNGGVKTKGWYYNLDLPSYYLSLEATHDI